MKLLIYIFVFYLRFENFNSSKASSKMFDFTLMSVNTKRNDKSKANTNMKNKEEDVYDNFKKALVSIKSRPEVPFVTDTEEVVQSTGFIVDSEKGYIVTNRKAARFSPSFVKIQFYDGTIKNGRIIYTDTIVPFGIIQIEGFKKEKDSNSNKNSEIFSYRELKLGSTRNNFTHGSSVSIMGITPEGSYIKKEGKIINTNRNFSIRYGSLFQTSFDRVTNLAGSPVWNENNEVVGIHILATETTSYELRIDYVTNILDQLKKGTASPLKGDIGISLELVILGIAKINYKLKPEISNEIYEKLIKTGGPPEIILIRSVLPNSPSEGLLKTGDIIYKINDKVIGNDFLLIDSILNSHVNKEIFATVSRNGQILTLKIPKVGNTENFRIKKYVNFSNSYFHDITNLVKYFLNTKLQGVYLTYTNTGSPFSKVSSPNQSNKFNYVLTSINSQKINNMDEFVNFFKQNCDLESVYVEGIDFNLFNSKLSSDAIDLDFSNSLLQVNSLNEENMKWEVESVDLHKFCVRKNTTRLILDSGVKTNELEKNNRHDFLNKNNTGTQSKPHNVTKIIFKSRNNTEKIEDLFININNFTSNFTTNSTHLDLESNNINKEHQINFLGNLNNLKRIKTDVPASFKKISSSNIDENDFTELNNIINDIYKKKENILKSTPNINKSSDFQFLEKNSKLKKKMNEMKNAKNNTLKEKKSMLDHLTILHKFNI